MNLRTQLQFYISQIGFSPTELAKKAGVSKNTVFNWLSGGQVQNLDALKKVLDVISERVDGGVSLEELLFGTPKTLKSKQANLIGSLRDDDDGWWAGEFELKLRPLRRRK